MARGPAGEDRPTLRGRFRHPRLAGCAGTRERLAAVLAGCEGLPYNLRLVAKPDRAGDESAFCSELVARAFRRVGVPVVPGRREAAVLPHTLDMALRDGRWLDLTDSYQTWLAGPAPVTTDVGVRTGSPAAAALVTAAAW
jgi:hypothetical protein